MTVYNLGVCGDSSAEVRARWRAEADRRFRAGDDNRMIFSFEVSDRCARADATGPRVPHHRGLENAEAILREASGLGPVLMVGPLPIADDAVNARDPAG